MHNDVFSYIAAGLVVIIGSIAFYAVWEHQENEMFKEFNEKYKMEEENKDGKSATNDRKGGGDLLKM